MAGTNTSKNDRDFRRIVVWGSSLGAGFVTGTLQTLRPHLQFEVSVKTLVAFALGVTALWLYWMIIFHPRLRGWHYLSIVATMLLIGGGVWSFLYPVRFVNPAAFKDLSTGLIAAVCALSCVAGLLLLFKRFLDRDERENAKQE